MDALYTIGYEKADRFDFLQTLVDVRVDSLVDVRERAMSRRRGFAKTALREGLESVGIEYRHEPQLGSPSQVRNELKRSGDFARFFHKYDEHLFNQTAILDDLADMRGNVVLLCYERAPCECHRSSVARELSNRTGLSVQHLGVKAGGYERARDSAGAGTRQSLSPA